MKEITAKAFEKLLPSICTRETSQDPNGWTPKNPLWGHCAVVSLVAQNLFGGTLIRASLEHTRFAKCRSHYWNRFADGTEKDFTRRQFGNDYPVSGDMGQMRERSYVLSHTETVARYKLLNFRLLENIYGSDGGMTNPLFQDLIYRACFYNALDSPCQKKKFGCVIVYRGGLIYTGHNETIEPLRSLCEPTCIRFSIQSRTESMIGACGHAEEQGLWDIVHNWKDVPISECELYIAGFYPNSFPYLKTSPEHTCLRCAVQMYNARLKKIYVPVRETKMNNSDVEILERIDWRGITPEEAVQTARHYAMKEKSV